MNTLFSSLILVWNMVRVLPWIANILSVLVLINRGMSVLFRNNLKGACKPSHFSKRHICSSALQSPHLQSLLHFRNIFEIQLQTI